MEETPIEVIVDCATGEVTERPLTAEEIAARVAEAEVFAAEQAAREAAEAEAKAAAEAKLAALGLTAEDLKALLS